MIKEKPSIPHLIIFLASPILSFPLVLRDIYKNKKYANAMLVFFFGVVSYLYVPFYSNDRVRYLELYDSAIYFTFNEFIQHLDLINRPDFILHLFIFTMAKVGVSFKISVSIVTMITIGVWLKVYEKIVSHYNINRTYRFLGIILLLLGIQYASLVSGIRFYFASVFILLALYYFIFTNIKIGAFVLLIIATFIHFSAIFFILVFAVTILIKNKTYLLNIFFIGSFTLLFVDPQFYLNYIDLSFLGDAFSIKQEVYLESEDFITSGVESNISNLYIYIIGNLWFIFYIFYLIFTLNRKSSLRSLLLVTIIFLNAFYHFPTVHYRYLLIVKLIAILLILVESFQYKVIKPILILAFFFFLNLLTQWIVLRINIDVSYVNINNILLPGIFLQEQIEVMSN